MEELNDDGLQDLLSNSPISSENTLNEKDTGDLVAYRNLFKVLDTEPEQGLSFSFASNVRRKIQEQLNRKSDRQFNIIAITIFILSSLLGYGSLLLIDQTSADMVLNMVLKFKWLLLSATCLFFGLLLINQRLTKRDY